ncbi:MAG: leucine-rich repeat protein [Clostridiales bacterium]|nr:leucine-rich repeat protein [Clostridiales bacterium]
MTSIKIQKGVTEIGEWAFYGCSGLTRIKIPEGVTEIGEFAFYNCIELSEVEIPHKVTKIERGTFKNCFSLKKVGLSDETKRIEEEAFYMCDALQEIKLESKKIENNIIEDKGVGEAAFFGCPIKTIESLPDSFKSKGAEDSFTTYNITSYEEAGNLSDYLEIISELNRLGGKKEANDGKPFNLKGYLEHRQLRINTEKVIESRREKAKQTDEETERLRIWENMIEEIDAKYESGEPNHKFFFRGVKDRDYDLLPSAFRSKDDIRAFDAREDYYYYGIQQRCPQEFTAMTHLDELTHMQHHGVPTRLLDVSANPLAALYFACMPSKDKNKGEIGRVYIFIAPEVLHYKSSRALMLSCLACFNSQEKQKLYDDAKKRSKDKNAAYDNKEEHKRLLYEIRGESPTFEDKIKDIHLLSTYFVQPQIRNNRIMKQDGAFILCGLSKNAEEAEKKIKDYSIVRIDIKNKSGILKELELLGINYATLFPDIDGVAKYLTDNI